MNLDTFAGIKTTSEIRVDILKETLAEKAGYPWIEVMPNKRKSFRHITPLKFPARRNLGFQDVTALPCCSKPKKVFF